MVPKKDDKPVDPRSEMTTSDGYMPRSFHAPSTLAAFANYIRQHEDLSPTEAVRKALRLCGKRTDYDVSADPSMKKAVELTKEAAAS